MLPRILSFLLPLSIYVALVLTAWGIYRGRQKPDRYAIVLGLAAFLASLAVRPNQHLLFFDEDIYIQIASNLSHAPVAQLSLFGGPKNIEVSTYYKEPAGFPVLLSFVFFFAGTHEMVAFLVARVLYGMAVMAAYLLARALVRTPGQAIAAAVAFAAAPACFAFSASAGTDIPAALFTALGVWGIVSENETLAVGALAMAAQTRMEMVILAPLILFIGHISAKRKAAIAALFVPVILHIAWVLSIASKLAAVEHVASAFSTAYVLKNLYANARYLVDPRLFPILALALAVVAAFYNRRNNWKRPILIVWVVALFVVYVSFYAGSFEINPRYSIQLTLPLALLAVSLSENPLVLAAIAFSAILPAMRPWQLPTYVEALASDHQTAVEFSRSVAGDDLVISGEPEIFLNQGKHAMNAVFAAEQTARIADTLGKFGHVFYYGGIRTDESGTEQWEADQKVKAGFELHLIEAHEFAGLRIAIYQLLNLIHWESGQALGLKFIR